MADVKPINPGVELPEGFTMAQLTTMLNTDRAEYSKAHQRAKRVDALDRNKLWEAIAAKFPKYQLLPQTNHVSYIKNNILASVYTVGKSAQLMYTSEEDKDLVSNLNIALEHIWETRDVAFYQLQAGERAALLNLGITQVGWDNHATEGKGDNFSKGRVVLKNIDPLKYYRDPFATRLEDASHVITWDDYHESVLASSKMYKDEFKKYKEWRKSMEGSQAFENIVAATDKGSRSSMNKPGYHRVHIFFLRDGDAIHEVHVIDGIYVLRVIESISPSMFPFAELYCNLPSGDLMGTSEPAKVADNSIVYNIMSSIISTSEYKNQRPPRFVNAQSGINVNAFTKHGNDADRTFVVNGDASKAVQYHTYPVPSAVAMQTMGMMQSDMQMVTGVDGKYTGRDTGSILTTGGIDAMLDQATLIDTTKVALYEHYCKRLSKLIIYNYICNSAISRKYLKDEGANRYSLVEVDFPNIPEDIVFEYNINISSEMPKNKARMAQSANDIMQMQMQYAGAGIDVDLITPQEWLMMQDIPNKEFFQERMNIQRTQNWQELVAQAVTQYAALVDQGVSSADAINATAQTMQQQQMGQAVDMEEVAQNTQLF